jgi:hypothetical protein
VVLHLFPVVYIEKADQMAKEVAQWQSHCSLSGMEVGMVEEVGHWQSYYFLSEMEVGMAEEEYLIAHL